MTGTARAPNCRDSNSTSVRYAWRPGTAAMTAADPAAPLAYSGSLNRGGGVGATGLAANPAEYRVRLQEQADQQLDAWAAELMRDIVIRRGIVKVVNDFKRAARLDERSFERVFAAGGGPPAVVGRDRDGHQVVPAVALWALVPGIRAETGDGRDRLIEYLVENFEDL